MAAIRFGLLRSAQDSASSAGCEVDVSSCFPIGTNRVRSFSRYMVDAVLLRVALFPPLAIGTGLDLDPAREVSTVRAFVEHSFYGLLP
jgi:hypothetical protein